MEKRVQSSNLGRLGGTHVLDDISIDECLVTNWETVLFSRHPPLACPPDIRSWSVLGGLLGFSW